MYCVNNKLNRSQSETDLCIPEFGNLNVNSTSFPNNLHNFENLNNPIVRRVYVEEVISTNKCNFFNMRRTKISEVIDDIPGATRRLKNKPGMDYKITQYSECEEVPMDVDNSVEDQFLKLAPSENVNESLLEDQSPFNCNDNVENTPNIMPKKKMRVLRIKSTEKKLGTNKWSFLLVLLVSIFVYYYYFVNTTSFANTDIQIENLTNDLVNNVHGHKTIIKNIVRTFEERSSWNEKVKVLSFVGSQGVGKTYIGNLIKKHFPQNLAHDIYGSHLYYEKEKQRIVDSINTCCLNFILIDDLKQDDGLELFAFIKSLPKDSFILLVTIFNIHYTDNTLDTNLKSDHIVNIKNHFDKFGFTNYELFIFEDFTKDEIKDWMKKQLHLNNVSLSVQDTILQTVLDYHNMKHGLKGLHSKFMLELEKYKD